MSKINDFCRALGEYAGAHCGCEYEISASTGDSFEVKVLEGEIISYGVNDYTSVSFKVKKNGKMGYASTTALDEDGIPALVSAALENAAVNESPDEQFIYGGAESYPHPKVYGEELDGITAEEKIELAKQLEINAKKADPMIKKVEESEVVSGSGTVVIKNSHGLDLSETSNFIYAIVVPIAERDGKMNSGVGICGGFDRAALDIGKAVADGVQEAVDFCGAGSMKSASRRVIFRNNAFCDMISTFSGIFSSENAQKGLSLLAGREGEKIASDCVSFTDDSTVDFAFGSRSFDSEGVPGQRTEVVENGVLKTLLYNLKTANKAGVRSTGNASGGGVSVTNFSLRPGDATLERLCEKAKEGFIITDVSGLHAGANAMTGDFSLMAKGYKFENGGKDKTPVTGVTVSGNFYELLKNVEEVGSDVYVNMFGKAVSSPSVLLSAPMSIAGE
ncbi:MAG: TldD/PmbA family protein [Clostridia bacterium]|nr:TldD/PmbA family protein [Clostridia bacterium]